MSIRSTTSTVNNLNSLAQWRAQTVSRRRLLLGLAEGSLAALMPLSLLGKEQKQLSETDPWTVLEAVQNRLFPSEPNAPGARELNALTYLKWVVGDPAIDAEDRRFILRGVDWLDDLSRQTHQTAFLDLSESRQEAMLQQIAQSEVGENWLATLLLYIFEALLTDPIYGGNPAAIGWRWLRHRPGFPRPDENNRYKIS